MGSVSVEDVRYGFVARIWMWYRRQESELLWSQECCSLARGLDGSAVWSQIQCVPLELPVAVIT